MSFTIWLASFSLLFLILERLAPRRPMKIARPGFWYDALYLILNGHYLGLALGLAAGPAIAALDQLLDKAQLRRIFYVGAMANVPAWLQFIVLLLVFDLLQWAIHRAFHQVPWLWRFHRVHHSVENFDWISNWRFHWMEAVVYRSLLYLPVAFFGFCAEAMFTYAALSTFLGHFSHSNLRVSIGPLKYLFNNPDMHIWHHTHGSAGPINRNFGINLSLWDWLFGTAYLPENRDPARLGFTGIESFPKTIWGQFLAPLRVMGA